MKIRIDHIAFRVKDRLKAVNFFTKTLGYNISPKHPNGFRVDFEDGTYAQCTVLEPQNMTSQNLPWAINFPGMDSEIEYHRPPEIFVSEGSPGSIVDNWVQTKGNGLHHIALLVDSIEKTKEEWLAEGFAEFATEEPTKCPGLTQIFTKPSDVTGIIWELIEREENQDGFCVSNVKTLMESTVNSNSN